MVVLGHAYGFSKGDDPEKKHGCLLGIAHVAGEIPRLSHGPIA